jgi:type IV pilus biogenesis protein PilP
MGLPERIKSKKALLGSGAFVIILIGFFVLKFMTAGPEDVAKEKPPPSAPRTAKKISKPEKKEKSQSPLFEALEALKDPFRGEDPKLVGIQEKIDATKKEIELLKASLEEKKLRQEIKEIEKSIRESPGTSTPGGETPTSTGGKTGEDKSQKRVLVKAILITDDEKSALVASGNEETWVHEGEKFDGWEIKEIKKDSVILQKAGKTSVFFYDRPSIAREGES